MWGILCIIMLLLLAISKNRPISHIRENNTMRDTSTETERQYYRDNLSLDDFKPKVLIDDNLIVPHSVRHKRIRNSRVLQILEAIQMETDIIFEYTDYYEESSERKVTPISVYYYRSNSCYYLVAFCHMDGDQRTFRISRMSNIELVSL